MPETAAGRAYLATDTGDDETAMDRHLGTHGTWTHWTTEQAIDAIEAEARALALAEEPLDVFYAVVFGNYDPPETDGLYRVRLNAENRADFLNGLDDSDRWAVHERRFSDRRDPGRNR